MRTDRHGRSVPVDDGRRQTLKELFQHKSPEEWRAVYADAFDWGADVGREIVED